MFCGYGERVLRKESFGQILVNTMKTLYIVRHAKALQDEKFKDWERPLLGIGIERADKVSLILKKKKICPDKIISSHAFRALNTAVIFALHLEYPINEIEISYDIYAKRPENVLDLIKKQDDALSSLMLFGHNPVFTDICNLLSEENLAHLSTSAVACIQFDCENWRKIYTKKGKSMFIETGK